nr:hypothetical protein BaRGS_029698 [Batillaria attramentaria]
MGYCPKSVLKEVHIPESSTVQLSDDKVDHLPRNLALENIVFRFQELQSTSLSKSKSFDLTAISPHSFDHSLPADPDLPVFAEEGGEESWCAQWSISVEKNMSKIGNIDSGYLFGVGVAREVLNSKDQMQVLELSSRICCQQQGGAACLLGKTVLSEPGYKVKVHPVFTVSQRVKLQFVSCSSV